MKDKQTSVSNNIYLKVFALTVILSLNLSLICKANIFNTFNADIIPAADGVGLWGDFDNDGDLDILSTGYTSYPTTSGYLASVFRNDGASAYMQNFTEVRINYFGVTNSSAAWGDFDNDGDLDCAVIGFHGQNGIYKNINSTSFGITFSLPATIYGSVAWGDYDNDGDLDLLLSGFSNSKIYRNDGSDVFTDISAPLALFSNSSSSWVDYDNDGDLDIFLTGKIGSNYSAKIYRNDGGGTFTDIPTSIVGVINSSCSWGDYDSDGDLDLLLTGYSGSSYLSKIYRNDSGGTFTDILATLAPAGPGSEWGDYDNDGDLDLILFTSDRINIYRNDGSGVFTQAEVIYQFYWTPYKDKFDFGDFDNDGDLDFYVAGWTEIYRNDIQTSNTSPSAPQNLSELSVTEGIKLIWDKATDTETPQNGLSYNLRVGTTPGGSEIISPMSDPGSGFRRIPSLGNVNQNTSWVMKNLQPGTYYWSVQSVDSCFAGSSFAQEGTFIVSENTPTAITLSSFKAKQRGRKILIKWKTASEIDNLGFNILRSDSENGTYAKINDALIKKENNAVSGAKYKFKDRDISKGNTYFYKLEDIDKTTVSTLHDAVEVKVKGKSHKKKR